MRTTLKALSILLCVTLVGLVIFLRPAKQRAWAMQCGSNLTSVSFAARLFSTDHDDTFASNVLAMSNEVITAKVLICPGDKERRAPRNWNKLSTAPWTSLTTNDFTYEWLGRGERDTNANLILLRCPIHGFTAHADSRVLDRDGKIAPNGKMVGR